MNETHLVNEDGIDLTEHGFKWIGFNRTHTHIKAPKGSGGVGVVVKDWLFNSYCIDIVDKSYEGILGVRFVNKYNDFTLILFTVYLPPENSPWGRDASSFYSHLLTQIYLHYESDAIVVCGDLNARIGNTQDCNDFLDNIPLRNSVDATHNQHGSSFLEFLNDSRFCTLNGRFGEQSNQYTYHSTRGQSVVDYICVPHDVFPQCKDFCIVNCNSVIEELSAMNLLGEKCKVPDHSVLKFKLVFEYTVHADADENKSNPKKRFNLRRIPSDFMNSNSAIHAINLLIRKIELCRETQREINEIYENFCEMVISEMTESIPNYDWSRKSKKKLRIHKPYWNNELTELWKTMRNHEKKFLKCNVKDRHKKRELRENFKHAQNILDKRIRYYERNHNRTLALNIESVCSDDPRKFWEHIKRLGPNRKKQFPTECYDDQGEISSDEKLLKQTWYKEFKNLYNPDSDPDFDAAFKNEAINQKLHLERMMLDPLYIPNTFLNSQINEEEIRKVVYKTKNGKSVGVDELPYEVLKNENVVKTLHKMFQLCFDSGIVPQTWSKAIIYPIIKDNKSDPRIPLNYRGISLLSVVAKIFSSVLNNRLLFYLEESDILVDEQNGFRKDRSCIDHIFTLNSIIENNEATFVTFIDLQKAFDMVDRELLQLNLLKHGIDGNFYHALKSLYSNTESCIRIGDRYTEWFECSSGVRQGDNLSPTLFALFINDLATAIKALNKGVQIDENLNLSILLYADDIAIISPNEKNMQDMLNVVDSWCKKWRLRINPNKSKIVHFRKKRKKRSTHTFYLGGENLTYEPFYKYLGVIFDENCDFKRKAENLGKSGGRALGSMISKIHSLKMVGFETFEKLYLNCVAPILDYCSGVWGTTNYYCTEMVQSRALRYFLGVHRFTPLIAIQGECGWMPCYFRQQINVLRLWNRLMILENDRLTKKIFLWDREQNNKTNWTSKTKLLLDSLNMPDIYTNLSICSLELAERLLCQQIETKWTEDLQKIPKLRTYRLFKNQYKLEDYVSMDLTKPIRSAMAMFRCGVLPLRIETGRYKSEPPQDRICQFCNNNEIENEKHFLLHCKLYEIKRIDFFRKIGFKNLSDLSLDYTFFSDILCKFPRQSANFIFDAFKTRQNFIKRTF